MKFAVSNEDLNYGNKGGITSNFSKSSHIILEKKGCYLIWIEPSLVPSRFFTSTIRSYEIRDLASSEKESLI